MSQKVHAVLQMCQYRFQFYFCNDRSVCQSCAAARAWNKKTAPAEEGQVRKMGALLAQKPKAAHKPRA